MSAFQPPISRDNYCRYHGSYNGYTCPECASEREKEKKDRICPTCQQDRVVNVKYMYCTNSKCTQYLIMYLKT
jgi:anaerobic ribonucleoside-triphosphate reductase